MALWQKHCPSRQSIHARTGFAHRLPDTRVIAYESDVTRLNLIRKYRALNGVADRIAFRGECNCVDARARSG